MYIARLHDYGEIIRTEQRAMSILPLPEPVPEAASEGPVSVLDNSAGIHLSVLDAYTGHPGTLLGVSFWPRVGARVIDLIVHNIIAVCAGFFFGIMVGIAAAIRHQDSALLLRRPANGVLIFTLALLGSIILEAICEGFHGSTPGKLILGFTVVQEDGSPCRFGPALIRSFAYLIDALFFGMIGYSCMQKSPQEQRHGDEWARTVVCRRSQLAPANVRGFGHFAAVFLLAAMADAVLLILGQVIRVMG